MEPNKEPFCRQKRNHAKWCRLNRVRFFSFPELMLTKPLVVVVVVVSKYPKLEIVHIVTNATFGFFGILCKCYVPYTMNITYQCSEWILVYCIEFHLGIPHSNFRFAYKYFKILATTDRSIDWIIKWTVGVNGFFSKWIAMRVNAKWMDEGKNFHSRCVGVRVDGWNCSGVRDENSYYKWNLSANHSRHFIHGFKAIHISPLRRRNPTKQFK